MESTTESKVENEMDFLNEQVEMLEKMAKENLQKDKELEPVVFLSCISDGSPRFNNVPAGERTNIIDPIGDLLGGDSLAMLKRLVELTHENPEEVFQGIDFFLQHVPPTVEDPLRVVLNILLKQLGMHQKDIVPLHIQDNINQFNAHAVVMVNDAYIKTVDSKEEMPKDSLVGDPDAREGILISVQTRGGYQATIQCPYVREGDGSISFEETQKIESQPGEESVTGRFFGLFNTEETQKSQN